MLKKIAFHVCYFLFILERVSKGQCGYELKARTSRGMEYSYGLLTDFPADQLDFNDNYIYLFAKQHGAILITDDGDYSGLDVKVATYNKKIYTAYKDAVKPNVGLR
ncbi:hypothetical protein [Sphingobacterium paucimobilis]|uniref:PIN domain-containing protein n=1 Tax=Sphingobacterium paucimobilis HER1398 TaxID=1346330 RepID=U2J2Z5_9SPHI|nr:hypothetical protein [Sphingobacterium paucimobilis]ERJ59339.1 hypothetical protein M472_11195 [Sphingobacterium paucimobilis HER1398]